MQHAHHVESHEPEAWSQRPVSESLRDLPIEAQDVVAGRLIEAAEKFQATRDIEPLARLLDSLWETARLHRNPAYRKALAEADDTGAAVTVPATDLQEYLRVRRERRHT